MFKNYFKVAYRNLMHHKGYTAINILGLAVGLSAAILILLYILFEFSFDRFHANADDIYRVSIVSKKEGSVEYDSHGFVPPMGPAMKRDFPEVDEFVRISSYRTAYFFFQGKAIKVNRICHVDSSLFEIFSFQLIAGNRKAALAEPYSIVLTETTAKRIFGSEPPLGKTVNLDDGNIYNITGIVKDPPSNSHIQFNTLISFSTLYKDPELYLDWDGGNQYTSYVKLSAHASPQDVDRKLPDFMWGYMNKRLADIGVRYEPYLQPLRKIHLQYDSPSTRTNIFIFSAIALLILLMACINFVNLSTARAGKRAREVGVRKVLGAKRQNIAKQFLTESVLLSVVSLVLAVLFVELFLPVYEGLVSVNLGSINLLGMNYIWVLPVIILLVGVLAGGYPAFYLSSFQAVETLKGAFKAGKIKPRNILVVLQFAISIGLIICAFLINDQLRFMKNKDLGFDKESIVVVPFPNDEIKSRSGILKNELSRLPGVLNVAASSEVPIRGFTMNGYFPQGFTSPLMIHVVDIDEDFLKTFDIKLVNGRNFSKEFPTDREAYLINESLAELLGWDDPLGKTIRRNGDHKIIGVAANFHYATLYDKVEPLIITNRPWRDRFDNLSIKIGMSNVSGTLGAMEETWQRFAPAVPFEYWFLDESFDSLYRSEQRFREIFFYFCCLALFIALLGLFGLASCSVEQRTKEIGVRKVLGATAMGITSLLSKDFLKLVIVANIISWPISWFAMNHWLQGFAYRIEIGWWAFLLAGGLALLIALLTVSTQAIRVAVANPVKALRYE